MRRRPRNPALRVLGSRRRPSAPVDAVAAERCRAPVAMDPGERLARARALSSFALKLRGAARLPRVAHPLD